MVAGEGAMELLSTAAAAAVPGEHTEEQGHRCRHSFTSRALISAEPSAYLLEGSLVKMMVEEIDNC